MPVPAVIAAAAHNYKFNSDNLDKTVADLAPEEWLKSPGGNLNHIAWIVGHVIWARQLIFQRLNTNWPQPGLDLALFARGVKLGDAAAYPAPDVLLKAWRESSGLLATALESVPEDLLAQPAPAGPPTADGKISGLVNTLAIHETYHLGQASYLRGWLGHKSLMG